LGCSGIPPGKFAREALFLFTNAETVSHSKAQGIEAVSFFAAGKKDTSGKPGPAPAPDAPRQN
jgi:hypothetical protein